jgi:hypothetical protein
MDNYKLRIKIGNNEFEAEGPKEAVMTQFEAFKELVSGLLSALPPKKLTENGSPPADIPAKGNVDRDLDVLFRTDKDLVSLRIMPTKGKRHIMDAVLLSIYGHKFLLKQDEVLGTQLKASLRQSGIIAERIDRKIESDIKEGLILTSGYKKGTKYRLTNKGMADAEKLIQAILDQIPND